MKKSKRLLLIAQELLPTIQYVLGYWIWVWAIRLLALSLITYSLVAPSSSPTQESTTPVPKFQDISDAFRSNEVSLMGLSAGLFLFFLFSLKPQSDRGSTDFGTLPTLRQEVEHRFMPGFAAGAALAGMLAILMNLFGGYQYLGTFIRLSEAPIEIANIGLRMCALILLAISEEWIFRRSLGEALAEFQKRLLPNLSTPIELGPQVIAILYCVTKSFQFELGWMHLLSLYLISLSLSYRTVLHGSFFNGAGFWAAALVVFQPLLSLPIFGNEFSGVLLLKFESHSPALGTLAPWSRLAFGGAGGPLASVAFQLLVLFDCAVSSWRIRRR